MIRLRSKSQHLDSSFEDSSLRQASTRYGYSTLPSSRSTRQTCRVIPPAGVPPIVNGFDMNAVEAALRLRDDGVDDAEIVIFSVGTGLRFGRHEETIGNRRRPISFGRRRIL